MGRGCRCKESRVGPQYDYAESGGREFTKFAKEYSVRTEETLEMGI